VHAGQELTCARRGAGHRAKRCDADRAARLTGRVVDGGGEAAALAGHGGTGKIVCIVSGGNIDTETLASILRGETPG
jgi:threonine dehydratase